jgi:hypothetical protein
VISKESRCDDKSCSSFSKDRLDSRLNFDLLLQYIIVAITDESLDKRINDIERELEQMYNQKAKGAQIRSREKWVELGEQNNSYLLGLEKQRQDKKYISKLLDENNKVIKDQGEKYLTQLRTTMKNIIRRKEQMKFLQKYIFLIQN